MDTLVQDLRFALRSIVRRPGFAAVVILTLALGIGANSAIFSVVSGVLLRPLPFREPDRLVLLWTMLPDFGKETASLPDYRDWRDRSRSFTDVAAMASSSFGLSGDGTQEPERVPAQRVSAGFFRTLGVAPVLGRAFTPEDEREDARVLVVSHGLWQRRLGGRPDVVGSQLLVGGVPWTIVGVAPRGFRAGEEAQLWAPLDTRDPEPPRRADFLTVIARMKPGVTIERAQAEMDGIARRLEQEYPETNARVGVGVVSVHEELVGPIRPALLVFMGAVGLVLLIACANVANLMLARATTREREMAVRAALGAGRGRLVRQVLTESVVLAMAGAALGLVLATWGVAALRRAEPGNIPRLEAVAVDGRVLLFTVAVALVVGLLFGLAPALRVSVVALGDALRDGLRAVGGGSRLRDPRALLILAEVSLAVLLVAGAGLLIRSFERLQRVDVGVRPDGVTTGFLAPPPAKYDSMPKVAQFYDRLVEELRRRPDVRDVALANQVPVSGGSNYLSFEVEGVQFPNGTSPDAQRYIVTPSFFRLLGIPLVKGRALADEDRDGAVPVVVINERMARQHFAGTDPIGRRISFGDTMRTIVGIVGDTRQEGVSQEPYAQAYVPFAQLPRRGMSVVLRTTGDAGAAAGTLKEAVTALDRDIAVADIATMRQMIDRSIAQPRVNTALLAVFAAVALLLAAIGIYGVTSYAVAQRTREIGVRMALGARSDEVLRLVVRQGMLPVVAGLGVGLLAALAATRLLRGLLYGVGATDPVTFLTIPLLLVGVALAASIVPALRASRIDPAVALRQE